MMGMKYPLSSLYGVAAVSSSIQHSLQMADCFNTFIYYFLSIEFQNQLLLKLTHRYNVVCNIVCNFTYFCDHSSLPVVMLKYNSWLLLYINEVTGIFYFYI